VVNSYSLCYIYISSCYYEYDFDLFVSVFSTQGVTPTSKTSACSPFQRVMQEKTQRFILVRAREGPTSSGRESVCIILHLSASIGVNTGVGWMEYGGSSMYVSYVSVSAPERPLL